MPEFEGWKILRKTPTGLTSYAILTEGSRVEYQVGHQAIPKPACGPLVVFDTFERAVAFLKNNNAYDNENVVLYACRYTPSAERKVWRGLVRGFVGREVGVEVLPLGTVLATKVEIIGEDVKQDDLSLRRGI